MHPVHQGGGATSQLAHLNSLRAHTLLPHWCRSIKDGWFTNNIHEVMVTTGADQLRVLSNIHEVMVAS